MSNAASTWLSDIGPSQGQILGDEIRKPVEAVVFAAENPRGDVIAGPACQQPAAVPHRRCTVNISLHRIIRRERTSSG